MDQRTPYEPIVAPPSNPLLPPPHESHAVGYGLLLVATIIWGINWPVAKYLLHELPPFTMRGLPGVFGALILAGFVLAKGQSLRVPRGEWGKLILYATLMVAAWMGLMGLSLVQLPASETAILGATLPVWAAGLAWPLLGEELSVLRVIAIAMGIGGVVLLMGGDSIGISWEKVPGIAYALIAALLFALGTVLAKRRPLAMRPLAGAVWQIGLGCFPVALIGLLYEQPHFSGMTSFGWLLFGFCTVFSGGDRFRLLVRRAGAAACVDRCSRNTDRAGDGRCCVGDFARGAARHPANRRAVAHDCWRRHRGTVVTAQQKAAYCYAAFLNSLHEDLRARIPVAVVIQVGAAARIIGFVALHAVGDRVAAAFNISRVGGIAGTVSVTRSIITLAGNRAADQCTGREARADAAPTVAAATIIATTIAVTATPADLC